MGWHALAWLPLVAAPVAAVAGDGPPVVEQSVSGQGLQGWRLRDGALELDLVQRLPDQTRAFFEARGFGPEDADRAAGACVMQAILRNASGDVTLDVDLAQWRRTSGDDAAPMRLREDWAAVWEATGASAPARIAFYWSFFPTRQQFAPGDYNWGMLSLALPPGTVFDLQIIWREDDAQREAAIDGIRCAADG